MDFEYVALEWRTGDPKQDTTFAEERRAMLDRGWSEHLRAGWPQERMPRRLAGGACIMRRPKDEPRKWTKAELEVMLGDWHEALHDTRQIERLMERRNMEATGLQGRLSERQETIRAQILHIAELQAAIDQVVCAATAPWSEPAVPTLRTVHRVLYPLATKKEESNG